MGGALLALALLAACVGPAREAPAGISPREVLQAADVHLEAGRVDEASRYYSWLLESFPHGVESAGAQFGLARVAMLRGEYDAAAAEFSQFRLNFPLDPRSGLALLHISECVEKIEDARRQRQAALAKSKTPAPPAPRVAAPPPLLAAQVLVWDAADWKELDAELARLKAAGFNAVLFRAFSNPGDRMYPFVDAPRAAVGVYFRTKHAPVVADVLGSVTKLAHQHGLSLYAWMTSRYADYGLSGEVAERWAERTYDLATGAVLKGRGLDLFNDRVVDHLAALYEDLGRYPIDGILFQDDHVSRHTDGFSDAAQALYKKERGEELSAVRFYEDVYWNEGAPKPYVGRYTEAFWRWAQWKNERLLKTALRLTDAARKGRPDLKVAVNFMYEAASSPKNALAWLSQSISNAHRYPFDYYAVMAYHRQMEKELGLSLDQTLTLLRRMSRSLYAGAHPFRALFKLQIRDWDDSSPVSEEELAQVVAAIQDGAHGTGVEPNVAIVPYRGAADLARLPAALTGQKEAAAGSRTFPAMAKGRGSVPK